MRYHRRQEDARVVEPADKPSEIIKNETGSDDCPDWLHEELKELVSYAELKRNFDALIKRIEKIENETAALHRELDTEKRMNRFEQELRELRRANGTECEGENAGFGLSRRAKNFAQ